MKEAAQDHSGKIVCSGSCHCEKVKIAIRVPLKMRVSRCNCSICRKCGYLHLTISKEDLTLLSGSEHLTEYRFNSGTAKHLFCRTCGIKVFYIPRSHPDGYSVNVNCLDLDDRFQLNVRDFDGQNWEANIARLKDWKD